VNVKGYNGTSPFDTVENYTRNKAILSLFNKYLANPDILRKELEKEQSNYFLFTNILLFSNFSHFLLFLIILINLDEKIAQYDPNKLELDNITFTPRLVYHLMKIMNEKNFKEIK